MTAPSLSKDSTVSSPTVSIAILNSVVLTMLDLPLWIAFAALLFTGLLSAYIGSAVLLLGLGAIASFSVISFKSSWRGAMPMVQDVPAALLVVMVSELVASMPTTAAPDAQFATVVVAIATTTFVTGAVFYGLGRFQLGNLVRYFPYPVMAGFLAGTGWLLLKGGLQTIAPTLSIETVLTPAALLRWVPALALATAAYLLRKRFVSAFYIPTVLGIIGLGFYLFTTILGIPYAELAASGWYLSDINSTNLTELQQQLSFSNVNWSVILSQFDKILIIAVGSVIAMLLNTNGVEMNLQTDLDLDQDLKTTGIGNLLSSLVGGWPAYVSPALTSINAPNKQQVPLSGLLVPLFCLAVYLLGESLLSYVPILVLAVVLAYIGIDFIADWLIAPFKTLSRLDYGILLAIVGVVSVFGLLAGVGVGLVLAVLLFVMKYSRVNVIRHHLSGAEQSSRYSRGITQMQRLQSVGAQTQILTLQGYMFFGTANTLLAKVRDISTMAHVRYIILDFENVTGLDSTAALSFVKMAQTLAQRNIQLLYSALDPVADAQFAAQPVTAQHRFPSLDTALQHVEDLQLQHWQTENETQPHTLQSNLQTLVPDLDITSVMTHMTKQHLHAGDYLMRQGDTPRKLFFIASGSLTAQLERDDSTPLRLQTMGCGHVVGELGFYTGAPRTASIVCEEDSTVYFLTKADMEALAHSNPQVAATIHQLIVHLLANRVTHLVRVVDLLQK